MYSETCVQYLEDEVSMFTKVRRLHSAFPEKAIWFVMATSLLHNICMNNSVPIVNFDDNVDRNGIDNEGDNEEANADDS